ncbi:hypothetical protein MFLAVUS_011288 [Mucor flavus]|uniref:NAB co-repressor domain-containing protein n=1 Tax=Mucor flavus TaxID=439312 RepID=A0ABP9ZF73_9FUNG
MQTLKAFLDSIQLQQYHTAFLKAGATDQDLQQFIEFTDQELNELLAVLDMLPFHTIKFKKSLRELKNTQDVIPETDLVNALPSTRQFIISHATIYGKKTSRPLTSYEEAINQAALELALQNPILISKKGSLFDLAKKKLLQDGYRYKRGSSRSKLKEQESKPKPTVTEDQQRDILLKRQANAQRMSAKRLEKINVLQQQVDTALQHRQRTENKLATGCHDPLNRLALEAELIHYEETKIRLTKETSKLKAQERKHQWYKRRKLERTASQSTDEGFSSQNSCYMEEEERHSAFSIYTPSSSQEEYLPVACPRESDVRASSISDYDR